MVPQLQRLVSLDEPASKAPTSSVEVGSFQPSRYLSDPRYEPSHGNEAGKTWTGELKRNPLFLEARRRHELDDRPLHVKQQQQKEQAERSFVCEELFHGEPDREAPLMIALAIDLPEKEKEKKAFKRDPMTWTANKLKKHAEVRMENLTAEQIQDMNGAKQLEVSQWIQAAACRALEKKPNSPPKSYHEDEMGTHLQKYG